MSKGQSKDFTNYKIAFGTAIGFIGGYMVSKYLSKTEETQNLQSLKCGQYKRFITGHDENGKAIVIRCDDIPNRKEPINRNISVYNIWRCLNHKIANRGIEVNDIDLCTLETLIPLEPSINGSNFRIIEFRPETSVKDFYKTNANKVEAAWSDFGVNDKKVFGGKSARHPFMHRTESIDYAICLYGQILMVMDDTDVLIKAGDSIVQRATNHSWKNCFDETCVMCFVLISSE